MDEVRVVRREDHSLIVANEAGDEFRLIVDNDVLAELRHLSRQAHSGARINPREIQSLVRSGKSRSEIMEITGADESDIERYEEPVLAERRFILSSAQSVPVRTSPSEQSEEQFGSVIAERLIGLTAQEVEWTSWRDEEAGWMIGLDFVSHDVAHHAVWSFEHRKGALSPLTPDAVTLSKQGDVGERLIPKLRAVDTENSRARFDSDAFDRDELVEPEASSGVDDPVASDDTLPAPLSAGTEAAMRAGHPSTGSIPIVDVEAEFARRREIDQRAIKTPEPEHQDLGQTADLLDALRRRRGQREESRLDVSPEDANDHQPPQPVPLWASAGAEEPDAPETVLDDNSSTGEASAAPVEKKPEFKSPEITKKGKGRASIPSWDDILFGTRSEEDPH